MRLRGPLANSYPAAVALVIFALVPFLALTAAVFPLADVIAHSLSLSREALDITFGMADAAYAFGTVMAVQFAVHLPGRRMLLLYVTVFLAAAIVTALARSSGVFIAAFIVQGLCTSLMLIAAVPPLVIGWPPPKMPWTGTIMNLCVFGAVAIGPTIGAMQASTHEWRPLFWGVAAVGALALLFALLTFEDQPPQDHSAPWDLLAIGLAGGGCAAAFYGASKLAADSKLQAISLVPLIAGVLMIVALVVHQYRVRRPLMPVRQLATTLPVFGILIAMCASAAAFGLMELTLTTLLPKLSPTHLALLFLPEFGAAVATAALFGALFRTRFTPLLALSGMVMLTAAAAVLTAVGSGSDAVVALGAGLLGLGVGASVSPALFIAGFSLRGAQIQRVFALIELLRGVTAFLAAPVLIYLATALAASTAAGTEAAIWICSGIAAGGGLLAALLFMLGGGRLQTPDLSAWEHGEPAWQSPPLLAAARADSRRDRRGASPLVHRPSIRGR
jgi:MFS family permease